MPTVVKQDGFVVKVWGPPREHGPPHVHVEKRPDGLVIIRLSTSEKPQQVWEFYNLTHKEVVHAFRIVEAHEVVIRQVWEKLHGKATPNR